MVIFDKKTISNSEANYLLIDGEILSKKEISNYIDAVEGNLIIINNKEIEVVRKTKKGKTKNYIILNGKELCLDHSQSSYNLEKGFYKYATENNILIQNPNIEHARKDKDGNAYVLNGFQFKLGDGILSLIGERFRGVDNKFITSLNKSNGKFQIYRAVYDEKENPKDLIKEKDGYGWFVELFDNNIVGTRLIIDIDEDLKIFTLDIDF